MLVRGGEGDAEIPCNILRRRQCHGPDHLVDAHRQARVERRGTPRQQIDVVVVTDEIVKQQPRRFAGVKKEVGQVDDGSDVGDTDVDGIARRLLRRHRGEQNAPAFTGAIGGSDRYDTRLQIDDDVEVAAGQGAPGYRGGAYAGAQVAVQQQFSASDVDDEAVGKGGQQRRQFCDGHCQRPAGLQAVGVGGGHRQCSCVAIVPLGDQLQHTIGDRSRTQRRCRDRPDQHVVRVVGIGHVVAEIHIQGVTHFDSLLGDGADHRGLRLGRKDQDLQRRRTDAAARVRGVNGDLASAAEVGLGCHREGVAGESRRQPRRRPHLKGDVPRVVVRIAGEGQELNDESTVARHRHVDRQGEGWQIVDGGHIDRVKGCCCRALGVEGGYPEREGARTIGRRPGFEQPRRGRERGGQPCGGDESPLHP